MKGVSMTFHKANTLPGLPNGVKLFPFVLRCFQCSTNAQLSVPYEIHVISFTGGLRGNTITKETPQSSLFHFQAPDTAFLSFLVLFSFCTRWLLVFFRDERHLFGSLQRVTELWKSLVFQSCSFSILYPIWRWWSKGSELREKLKDVCFGVNNNKTNPQTHKRPSFKDCPSANAREHTAVFPYLKMHLVLMDFNGWLFLVQYLSNDPYV